VHDATVNGGATLKRVYVVGDSVRLEPRNPELQPIVVPADQVEIRGKVVQLLRDL
jgi:SOS-response transcriptional repressor LexA